jgi:hypothetical protein
LYTKPFTERYGYATVSMLPTQLLGSIEEKLRDALSPSSSASPKTVRTFTQLLSTVRRRRVRIAF